jgi:hypothetical protein
MAFIENNVEDSGHESLVRPKYVLTEPIFLKKYLRIYKDNPMDSIPDILQESIS